jgi:beta-galactosidase GanA
MVHDKPFLILGGELGNSAASARAYMQPIWSKLKAMHLNTVLMPVYWELMEPEENKFDFSLVDGLINDASSNNLHLVLLWFGTVEKQHELLRAFMGEKRLQTFSKNY